ncbi:DUF7511 domain-containing protein [Natronorubrum sulfidifaciens]|uniref:DUF7511 domain-containing protein n=1 Tax=Natronorubrum sulfidifaciens JCM 14089 TaxID=1230460 RepID=L9W3H5_9EURY|nr:hypothetical protein [Natronorubrum sulfidifaciens]ELY43856.1 hypothetical protein C495_12365 [Natronorubrum sulfidifaciens JCM 14089]
MTVNETPVSDDSWSVDAPLELLTDDENEVWTAVPADATGDERVSRWLSVDADTLCDLEAWR